MVKPYLIDIIINHKTQGEWKIHSSNTLIDNKSQEKWKIQLTMAINLNYSKDSDENRTIHTKNHHIEIMMSSETDEINEKLLESLLQKYKHKNKKNQWKEVNLPVNILYYKLHKIILNTSESHIDSPEWLKNKNATINPKSNDDKCFQYTLI